MRSKAVILLFLSLALGSAPHFTSFAKNVRRLLDLPNGQECNEWLEQNQQPLWQCFESGYVANLPQPTPASNCMVNSTMFDTWCNDDCFDKVMTGFQAAVDESPECLNYLNSVGDCTVPGNPCESNELCIQGQCRPRCNTKADCDTLSPCTADENACMVDSATNKKYCDTNSTTPIVELGNPNMLARIAYYNLQCSKNTNNDYCMVYKYNEASNPLELTCNDVDSWGCCAGTLLNYYQYCRHQEVINPDLYNCPNSQATCSGTLVAEDYCLPLCNGDNVAPSHGTTGNCTQNITSWENAVCEQTCKVGAMLRNDTSLQRTCQTNGRWSDSTAVCDGATSLSSSLFFVFSLILISWVGQ